MLVDDPDWECSRGRRSVTPNIASALFFFTVIVRGPEELNRFFWEVNMRAKDTLPALFLRELSLPLFSEAMGQ